MILEFLTPQKVGIIDHVKRLRYEPNLYQTTPFNFQGPLVMEFFIKIRESTHWLDIKTSRAFSYPDRKNHLVYFDAFVST